MAASSLLRSLTRHARGASAYHLHQPCSLFSTTTAVAGARRDEARKEFPGLGSTTKGGEGEGGGGMVLGIGCPGLRLMKDIDTSRYHVVCVAPRNHMVFTPLLASTY